LEQPILRLHEPLGEEQIVLALRVDVRDAGPIANDAHWRAQARELDAACHLRDQSGRRRLLAATSRTSGRNENEDREDESHQALVFYTLRMAIKDGLLADFDHEMGT